LFEFVELVQLGHRLFGKGDLIHGGNRLLRVERAPFGEK